MKPSKLDAGEDEDSSQPQTPKSKRSQPKIDGFGVKKEKKKDVNKYGPNHPCQAELTQAILIMIAQDMLPVSFFLMAKVFGSSWS